MRALLSALLRTIAAASPGYSPVTLGAAPGDQAPRPTASVCPTRPRRVAVVLTVCRGEDRHAARRTSPGALPPVDAGDGGEATVRGPGRGHQLPQSRLDAHPPWPQIGLGDAHDPDIEAPQLVLAALLLPQHAFGRAVAPGMGVLHPPVELDGDRRAVESGVDDGDQPAARPDLNLQFGRGKRGAHDPQPSTGLQG